MDVLERNPGEGERVESRVDLYNTAIVFTDSDKLRGRQFGYALGPDPGSEPAQFTESVSLSLYVDVEGVIRAGSPIVLHQQTDPIDAIDIPTFSRDNRFVQGLEATLQTVPDGTIILYPTLRIDRQGAKMMYPKDTPEGYVPCVGQTLKYPDGSSVYVPLVPVPANALYGARYMIKVPRGWKTPDPALPPGVENKELGTIQSQIFTLN